MQNFLSILLSILLAPIQLLLNPSKLMHLNWGGGLTRLSVPAIAAVLTFFFLLLVSIAVFFFGIYGQITINFQQWQIFVPLIILLVFLIPIITYFTIRFWMQDVGERFSDIENAWKAGLEELKSKGFDLNFTPLFLVLGSESSVRDQYFFAASQREFTISHFPRGKGVPLRWYASEDGVFVVLSHVGCVTELARAAAGLTTMERVQVSVMGPSRQVGVSATCWPTEDESSLVQASDDSGIVPPQARLAKSPAKEVAFAGTLAAEESSQGLFAPGVAKGGSRKSPPKLSSIRETAETRINVDLELRRLAFLCRLILETRRPFCPINGVLLELPLSLILADDKEGALTMNAVSSDFAMLNRKLGLRFPVVAVVIGWDEDLGFQEFTRRLGFEKTQKNGFGKGFGVGDPPLKDQLGALCTQSCRAFEDWIYKLFREPDALSKPGNRSLYSLLCKVRRYLYPRLDRVIADGLGCNDQEAQAQFPMIVGCYHAAAGAHEDTQAFCSHVFTKLIQANEDLEWTPKALAANANSYMAAYASLAVTVVMVLATIAIFVLPKAS